ncbi:MAG: hypothetical protein NVS3B20_03220 [Polyangiales bacterium]
MTGVLVARLVERLERYYGASAEDVRAFLRTHDGEGGREMLLLREEPCAMEMALVMPRRIAQAPWHELTLDERCQAVEGASHFLVVCDRARSERPTTQLELELQAEIDKWLILSRGGRLAPEADFALREALYDDTAFVHDAGSLEGERYRMANAMAARFVHRLSETFARRGLFAAMRAELGRFFRMGQEEKLRLIAA